MPSAPPLASLSGVTKRFGSVTAVWKVDLTIQPGDFWAIFGPNGAGKTTLLRMLARLTAPTEGQIDFPGESGSRPSIGYVSHQSLLYGELTGFENLVFFARLYGLPKPEERADELLERMGLTRARDRAARGYSSGMRQRLSLGRALLHRPRLLLFDEPYAGLDQHGSRLLTGVLEGVRAEGCTVLMITHNLGEGLALADHVAIMSRGQIVFRGRRDEFDSRGFEGLYFSLVEG
jgi:heme exporter protein A